MLKKIIFLSFAFFCLLITGCDTVNNVVDSQKTEYHHLFPREFSNNFKKAGIDVDNFTIQLSKSTHRGAGTGLQYVPKNWNDEWREFIKNNPKATQEDFLEQGKKMMAAAGARGEFKFYNFKTKAISTTPIAGNSGSILIISNSKFLHFCGVIGEWTVKKFGGYKWGVYLISFLSYIGTGVFGFFGIKTGQPVAVGLGLVVVIFSIIGMIGIIYVLALLVGWIINVLVPILIALIGSCGYVLSEYVGS